MKVCYGWAPFKSLPLRAPPVIKRLHSTRCRSSSGPWRWVIGDDVCRDRSPVSRLPLGPCGQSDSKPDDGTSTSLGYRLFFFGVASPHFIVAHYFTRVTCFRALQRAGLRDDMSCVPLTNLLCGRGTDGFGQAAKPAHRSAVCVQPRPFLPGARRVLRLVWGYVTLG